MKRIIYYFVIVTLFTTACQQRTASDSTQNEAATTPETPANQELTDGIYCYQQSVGRDTTSIRLEINGSIVTGEMNWIPYEKDSARGVLAGMRNGNEITAIWTYVIEGSNQTEEVLFKIEDNQLMRKVGELEDPNNDGNLKLKDPASAQYTEIYTSVDCS